MGGGCPREQKPNKLKLFLNGCPSRGKDIFFGSKDAFLANLSRESPKILKIE